MAGSTRQSREHKKWLAARRAQFRLQQQFDFIDFVEDVLNPESEALLSGKVALEIEPASSDAAQSIISVTVRDETSPTQVKADVVDGEVADETSSEV